MNLHSSALRASCLVIICAALFVILAIAADSLSGLLPKPLQELAVPTASAETLYVDDDAANGGDGSEEWPFNRIQDAINASDDGDTVRVWEGLYEENVVVDSTVSVIGNGSERTTIDGGGVGKVVEIAVNGTSLCSLTVSNGGNDSKLKHSGIKVTGNMTTIENVTVRGCYYGLNFYLSKNNVVRNCSFESNHLGGYWVGLTETTIEQNTFTNNTVGLYYYLSSRNFYRHNIFERNRFNFGFWWIMVWLDGDTIIDDTNLVDGRPILFLKDVSGITIDASSNAGLILCLNCTDITIRDIRLSGNINGIHFQNTSFSRLQNVTITGTSSAITFWNSGNNTITDSLLGGKNALEMEKSGNITVRNTTFTSTGRGIRNLDKDLLIEGCKFLNNSLPIELSSGGRGNIVRDCIIERYVNTTSPNNNFGIGGGSGTVIENVTFKGNAGLRRIGSYKLLGSNTVNGRTIYHFKDRRGGRVPADAGQVFMENCTDMVIEGIDFEDVPFAVYMYQCRNITIKNNSFHNTYYGIETRETVKSVITDNDFSVGLYGIDLDWESDHSIISNNSVTDCNNGIYLNNADESMISNNTVMDGRYGIWIDGDDNRLEGNIVTGFTRGVFVDLWYGDVAIENNSIYSNEQGIFFDDEYRRSVVRNNRIHNNSEFGLRILNPDSSNFSLDAGSNYWGAESGPFHPELNPNGTGDNITAYVEFHPWLHENGTTNVSSMIDPGDGNGNGNGGGGEETGRNDRSDSDTLRLLLLGISILLIGNVAILAYASEALRYRLLHILTPLYTRLNQKTIEKDIRQQNIRGRIYQHIKENPGTNFTTILKEVGSGYGNTIYHLSVLRRQGHIRSSVRGGFKLFWVKKDFPAAAGSAALTDVQRSIIELLEKCGELSRAEIRERTGIPKSTLRFNIKKLQEAGRIEEEKKGKELVCSLKT